VKLRDRDRGPRDGWREVLGFAVVDSEDGWLCQSELTQPGSGPHGPSIRPGPGPQGADRAAPGGRCEICGHAVNVEAHHVRKLADLDNAGQTRKPTWTKIMVKRRRKTLVVCENCHTNIHSTGPVAPITQ
jgi:hypothetical protein